MPAIVFGGNLTPPALRAALHAARTGDAGDAAGDSPPPPHADTVCSLLARGAQRQVEAALAAAATAAGGGRADATLAALGGVLTDHVGGVLEALRGCANVIGVDSLLAALPPAVQVPYLSLAGLSTFVGAPGAVAAFRRFGAGTEALDLSDTSISSEALVEVLAATPNLRLLRLAGCAGLLRGAGGSTDAKAAAVGGALARLPLLAYVDLATPGWTLDNVRDMLGPLAARLQGARILPDVLAVLQGHARAAAAPGAATELDAVAHLPRAALKDLCDRMGVAHACVTDARAPPAALAAALTAAMYRRRYDAAIVALCATTLPPTFPALLEALEVSQPSLTCAATAAFYRQMRDVAATRAARDRAARAAGRRTSPVAAAADAAAAAALRPVCVTSALGARIGAAAVPRMLHFGRGDAAAGAGGVAAATATEEPARATDARAPTPPTPAAPPPPAPPALPSQSQCSAPLKERHAVGGSPLRTPSTASSAMSARLSVAASLFADDDDGSSGGGALLALAAAPPAATQPVSGVKRRRSADSPPALHDDDVSLCVALPPHAPHAPHAPPAASQDTTVLTALTPCTPPAGACAADTASRRLNFSALDVCTVPAAGAAAAATAAGGAGSSRDDAPRACALAMADRIVPSSFVLQQQAAARELAMGHSQYKRGRHGDYGGVTAVAADEWHTPRLAGGGGGGGGSGGGAPSPALLRASLLLSPPQPPTAARMLGAGRQPPPPPAGAGSGGATIAAILRQLTSPASPLRHTAAGRLLADVAARYLALPTSLAFVDMLQARTSFLRTELAPVREALRTAPSPPAAATLADMYNTLLQEYRAVKAQLQRVRPAAAVH